MGMKGCDPIVSGELYQGTAKSAEGYLAGVLFQKAKDEGCNIGKTRIPRQRSRFVPFTPLKQVQG